MAGRKHRGIMHGKKPPNSAPVFKAGDERTKRIQAMGVKAHKEKCARMRTLREAAEAIRGMQELDEFGVKTGNTEGVAAVLAMYKAAKAGDSRAFKVLAEIMGEMETQITVKEIPKLIDDI